MSGNLCPSKSTCYIGNLPFSLTNNDLHKILEKYGKVVKVTTVKDRDSHRSTGVAFALYLERESAHRCVRALNHKELFGRTLKCNIANDNGRATEFIRRKFYIDKTRCYECGEFGHMSYNCPKNMLGDRILEKKKKKKRFRKNYDTDEEVTDEEEEDEDPGEDPKLESLSAAIQYQQEKMEEEEYRMKVVTGEYGESSETMEKKKRYKKSEYFSDEEEVEDT